jgi:antirestriction protein ArdC
MAEQRADVYARITGEIVAAIEAGAEKWKMPWHHDGSATSRPINLASNKPYRGINVLALWAVAERFGYTKGLWGTYRQWQAEGAQVRKGERGSVVVLWKQFGANDADDQAQHDDNGARRLIFARAFAVFNVEQVDGYDCKPAPQLDQAERFTQADAFVANLGIRCEYGGDVACYNTATDTVHMPHFAQFKDPVSFAGVLVHEHGHASGAKHRLNRDLSGSFGSASYAAEEICVEILSGFILADLGIAHHPRADHAAYVASWLKKLKSDPRAIFAAASKAQAAADWMHAQQASAALVPALAA